MVHRQHSHVHCSGARFHFNYTECFTQQLAPGGVQQFLVARSPDQEVLYTCRIGMLLALCMRVIKRFGLLRMPGIGVYHSVIAHDANSDFVGGAFNTKHQHASLRAGKTNTWHDTDPRYHEQTAEA